MVSVILLTILVLPLYWVITKYRALRGNIAAARRSGLPYFVAPVFLFNPLWLLTARPILQLLKKLPESWTNKWITLITPDWQWQYLYEPHEKLGDTIIVVSPERNVVWTANAEAIQQITARRDDFPKPLESYKVLDLYGRNMITTEGKVWRMHRKAAAPGFNEKNNAIVFKETISQTHGLLKKWTGPSGEGNITLKDVPMDTMRITLHIISRVGFGIRLLWPGEQLNEKDTESGFNYGSNEIPNGFTMSFETALSTLLDKIIWVLTVPKWLLKVLPIKNANKALESFNNWGLYMKVLYDQKVSASKSGELEDGMDIMGSLVRSQIATENRNGTPSNAETGEEQLLGLTETNIMGNSFVMLLAGHETTANTVHFALIDLASAASSQRRLQKDIDSIFGTTPSADWDYDRDINKCFGSMLEAVLNEELRIMSPVIAVPKSVSPTRDQTLTLDGRKVVLPKGAFVGLNACGVHRNPHYWHSAGPSKISEAFNDLNDFVPERWMVKYSTGTEGKDEVITEEDMGGFTGQDSSAQLFHPVPGSFIPFSYGARSCLGRRIAQVEVLAILAVIFHTYSVELAVDEWATDEEVDKMTVQERRVVYKKAQTKARETVRTALSTITLKLPNADAHIPLRLVRRGDERFVNVIN